MPVSPPIPRTRLLDSPIARSVSLWRFEGDGEVLMQPDNCWDIAFLRRDGRGMVLRTGMTTRPDAVSYGPGDEILTVSFRPEAFMALLPGEAMRNSAVVLDCFGRKDFSIGGHIREIPNFDNAEMFVERLRRDGIVECNPVVASVLGDNPRAISERTLQRHFLRTTGLTYKHFTLIERAQRAAALLQMGRPAVDVALTLGYADQAHLINSVRQIMGQTPGEMARAASP
jgi:hypothetical protein